ncbi:amino acid ABC transporter ATP-binding protein [Jeotgalibacillus alimentarius]|uniref:Amino acid ABC transporter ATP-binding protein n=1 Tax=Jeotgalibacillus alimentarius TaxID=135826 RepID=A0A0C2V3J1_9BACL|nr:phosphate ABC transporter ATP-binding protein [Jeotgalibacillus alimentarius]KIL43597.1 amino acid ABC transporter ATP-binding protein [Jeotgalibacillus alimentarius]
MSRDTQAAIQFSHVHYQSGDTKILNDITGWFPKNHITTLVGPSGAGKTTLFRLCNGLISPDSGEIYIDDQKISSYEPVTLRRKVGIALQQAVMVPGTVRKNLALPVELQGEELPEETAKEMIRLVGLDERFLDRNAKDLSGGQRQKVSIARTLVMKPEILLLDEITSSLDRVSQQEIEELIIRINETYQTTIMWITHNLKQALSIGEYTWVMMDGELVETGESSLLKDPQNPRVQTFVKGESE